MRRHHTITTLLLFAVFGGREASSQTPLHVFTGDSFLDTFGTAVDGAGDVNNDGYDDLIVGAPKDSNNGVGSGSARVFSGKDGSILYTFDGGKANEQFGHSVSGAGDVDNDGYADVIAGATLANYAGNKTGRARVHSGQTGALLHTFDGGFGAELGQSVAEAGDVNNDGFDDVVVGAYKSSLSFGQAGSVFVFSGQGGAALHTFSGDLFQDWLGFSVSGAGDVNADGHADVIGGAPRANSNGINPDGVDAGLARVWSGKDGTILYSFYGVTYFDELGTSVAGAGDVNGDGHDDVIAGAPDGDLNGGPISGYARVWSGATGAVLHTFSGYASGQQFGGDVAGVGDVNGDGRDDVMVSAFVEDGGNGAVRIYSGQDGAALIVLHGFSEFLGRSLGAAGDVDGDGTPDFITSSLKGGGAAFVRSGTNVAPTNPSFGAGCPWSGGAAPTLAMIGSNEAGGRLTMVLDGGILIGPGLLLGGLTETSLPAGCGCSLLVQPVVLQLPVNVPGTLVAGFTLPPGLAGATVKLQALVADGGNACGFTATNGVSVTFQ